MKKTKPGIAAIGQCFRLLLVLLLLSVATALFAPTSQAQTITVTGDPSSSFNYQILANTFSSEAFINGSDQLATVNSDTLGIPTGGVIVGLSFVDSTSPVISSSACGVGCEEQVMSGTGTFSVAPSSSAPTSFAIGNTTGTNGEESAIFGAPGSTTVVIQLALKTSTLPGAAPDGYLILTGTTASALSLCSSTGPDICGTPVVPGSEYFSSFTLGGTASTEWTATVQSGAYAPSGPLTNSGTLLVGPGQVENAGSGLTNNIGATITVTSGTLTTTDVLDAGTILLNGTGGIFTVSGTSTILSGGSLTLSGNGDNVTFSGPLTNTGAITVDTGETVNANGLLTNNNGGFITVTGGTFTATDAVNGGAISLNGTDGMLTASGPVTIVSGGSLTLSGNGDVATFSGPVTSSGTITVGTGETVNISGLLTNNSGGLITVTGGTFTATDAVNGGAISLNGTDGMLTASGPVTIVSGGSLTLSGNGDNVTFSGPLTNTGAITVSTGETVNISGLLTNNSGGLITGDGRNVYCHRCRQRRSNLAERHRRHAHCERPSHNRKRRELYA